VAIRYSGKKKFEWYSCHVDAEEEKEGELKITKKYQVLDEKMKNLKKGSEPDESLNKLLELREKEKLENKYSCWDFDSLPVLDDMKRVEEGGGGGGEGGSDTNNLDDVFPSLNEIVYFVLFNLFRKLLTKKTLLTNAEKDFMIFIKVEC
jgi:hypothetical protein